MNSMLDRISSVDWLAYPQPEWNAASSIPDALTQVACGDNHGHNNLLYAVGNNHAGTYYPVLLAVMPFLVEIACNDELASQRISLSVIDDLLASFQPEPGFEYFGIPNMGQQSIEALFRQQVHTMEQKLHHIATQFNSNSSLARQILQLLADVPMEPK